MSKLLVDARNVYGPDQVEGWMTIQGLSRGWFNFDGTVNHEKVKAEAEHYPHNKIAVFESESYLASDPRQIEIVDTWREVRPETRLGFYRLMPTRNYWAPIAEKWGDDEQMQAWKIENSQASKTRDAYGKWNARGLSDCVDFVCPSIYNMYPDWMGSYKGDNHSDLWFSHYAPAQVEMARRFGKQVYPYIWPRYHHPLAELEPLSIDLFRRQIQWCLDYADGVVVWDWTGNDQTGDNMIEKVSILMEEFV